MASQLTNPTFVGRATQTQAATQANHLVRLADLQELLASLASSIGAGHSGTLTTVSGQTGGTVTGLGLTFTPTKCWLTVRGPAGDVLGLTAMASGSLSADGFSWVFTNGTPESGGYEVSYLLLP